MFFDIKSIFILMSGEMLINDIVKIRDSNLEVFDAGGFAMLFKEICNLKHISELNEEH